MSARDDYPATDLLSGWARIYDTLWAELDRLRAEVQDLGRSPYHESKTFDRFKYAEEFAHGLDSKGAAWRISRLPDVTHEEDGETYTNPLYAVEWTE